MKSGEVSLAWVVSTIIILAISIPFITNGGVIQFGQSVTCIGQVVCYWGSIDNGTVMIIPDNENDTLTIASGSHISINTFPLNDTISINTITPTPIYAQISSLESQPIVGGGKLLTYH